MTQQFKTEAEFHAARRMFIIAPDGTLLLATKGDQRTHVEWLGEVLGTDEARAWIRNQTRGYVLGNRMVVYQGEEFGHHRINHTGVIHALDTFDRMTEGGITEIGVGAKYERGVQPWPPRHLYDAKEYYGIAVREAAKKGGGGGPG